MRAINLSQENVAEQWKYVKRNLKDLGIITQDSLETDLRLMIQGTLQRSVDREFEDTIKAKAYERIETRIDYRCGSYNRMFASTFGQASLKIPRARNTKLNYKFFDTYQRRHKQLDYCIALSMILGLSTRKQSKLFYEVIGDSVSHQTASELLLALKEELRAYREQPIANKYKYLILDGMWVHIKELNIHQRPVLFALGITKDNKKELISFKLSKGETEEEYTSLLNDLYRRGLRQLDCIIADGSESITAAVNTVYPYAQRQYCYTHKLRNLSQNIRHKHKHRAKMLRQAKKIYQQPSKQRAINQFNRFLYTWQDKEPRACKNFKNNFINTLNYYDFPKADRGFISTSNHLERFIEEIRRRTKIQGYFKNEKSLNLWIFGIIKHLDITIPEDVPKLSIEPEFNYESAQFN